MVEWTALEMRRTGDCTLGSNPSLSAKQQVAPAAFALRRLLTQDWVLAPFHYASVALRPITNPSLSAKQKEIARSSFWGAGDSIIGIAVPYFTTFLPLMMKMPFVVFATRRPARS